MTKTVVEAYIDKYKQLIILLSGFSGSGKTVLGKSLSKDFKIDFVNLTEKLNTQKNSKINITNNDSDSDKNKMQNIPTAVNIVMDAGLYQILQKILSNYNDSENKDNIINFFSEHYINTSKYLIKKIDELLNQYKMMKDQFKSMWPYIKHLI
mgnify:CR=1 FL=1